MANAFSKSDIVFFEQVIAGFENNNVVAKNTAIYTPNMEQMEQSGLTVKRPMPMISTSSSGRDVSSDYKDITQLVVPSTLAESDILNVPFKMNAVELNDPQRRDQKAMSAARQLSAQLDKAVATRVANYGSQVVVSANDMDTYAELSVAEAVLMEQGVSESMQRAMFLNPAVFPSSSEVPTIRQSDGFLTPRRMKSSSRRRSVFRAFRIFRRASMCSLATISPRRTASTARKRSPSFSPACRRRWGRGARGRERA